MQLYLIQNVDALQPACPLFLVGNFRTPLLEECFTRAGFYFRGNDMFLLVLVGLFCSYFHSICVRFFVLNGQCHHCSYYPFLSQLGSAPPSLSPRASVRHHPYSPLAHDTDDSTHDYQPRRNVSCFNQDAREARNVPQNYQLYFQSTRKRREERSLCLGSRQYFKDKWLRLRLQLAK